MVNVFEHFPGEVNDIVTRMDSGFIQGDRAAVHDFVHGVLRLDIVNANAALYGQRDHLALGRRDVDLYRTQILDELVSVFLFDEDEEVVATESCNHFVIVAHCHDGVCKEGDTLVANSGGLGLVDVLVVLEIEE